MRGRRDKKQACHQSKVAQEPTHSLPMMTSPSGCVLKELNYSYSHTSCFRSRRLRPQTPQGSDDEGGKSTLTIPYSVSLLTGKEKPSSPSAAHSSSGSRADKQPVRSSLFTDAHTIFLLECSMDSCVRTLPLTSVPFFDQRVTPSEQCPFDENDK